MNEQIMKEAAEQLARRYENMQGIPDYHQKRKTHRRQEDGKFEFLMTQVKLAIRLFPVEDSASKAVLKDAVDTIEKGDKI